MKMRYDFGDNLNLLDFRSRFLSNLQEDISYIIYLGDFSVTLNNSIDNDYYYINVYNVIRDEDEDIVYCQICYPFTDNRLKSLNIIKNMFSDKIYCAKISSSMDKNQILKDVCDLISVLHKIPKLKAFL